MEHKTVDKQKFRKLIFAGGTWESMSRDLGVNTYYLKKLHKEMKMPPLLKELKKEILTKKFHGKAI